MRRATGLAIEGWSPEYGAPVESEMEDVPADKVDASVEIDEGEWRPLDGDGTPNPRADFVDGVRRMEARVWIAGRDGESRLGVCASFAAGLVRCGERATVDTVKVGRGFFALAGAPDLATRAGNFRACPVAEDDMPQLVNGLQERMWNLEVEVAASRGGTDRAGDSLLVLDGPLRGRRPIPGAIGYVKSHRVHYLPDLPRQTVARLGAGQRTPVFLIQTRWTRYSWYMRLTEARGHPWAGIVRCEAWTEQGLDAAKKTADRAAATLPRFASEPHKDDRAPQNLYPIAGLERELGRRLGDRGFVYRALQQAAATFAPGAKGGPA